MGKMKVDKDYNLEGLLAYGFEKIDRKEEEENENYNVSYYDYKFNIGHARRGQFYYLLISESQRTVLLYASEPDGSGTSIEAPDVLIELINKKIITK